jgi:hypothetical protein
VTAVWVEVIVVAAAVVVVAVAAVAAAAVVTAPVVPGPGTKRLCEAEAGTKRTSKFRAIHG